ncbi:hypothetical protein [Saccharopolyspora dendranthemae]|uniref:Uncharacterized protein n=1 Tax=Saccharopolyspora dendranthemae TaxID=1181886 RepID=A0A561U8T0_9PSEU|nr:hypothetical protein [Saccharopolyspora dendranthemae]TWF95779.1 hypothetical protein FHU35_12779 [Saccharopolyspora dendranthemae]
MTDPDTPPAEPASADFPWFERTRVFVVEGEVLASAHQPAEPDDDRLVPRRSTC